MQYWFVFCLDPHLTLSHPHPIFIPRMPLGGGESGDSYSDCIYYYLLMFVPGSSAGKESACSAGVPGLIPGLGRSAGEGIGYTLQYSWASLVAQLIKNLPATRDTWVQSLDWEDPVEKGKATHSSILAWRIPRTVIHGAEKSWTQLSD